MADFGKLVDALQNLPVSEVARDVVNTTLAGKATVLTSDTGSGKTLLANSMLADATDEQVVVLVPRRFLAMNAAETIAELSGNEVGKKVGFAVGKQAGEESSFSRDTKLLFTTYGYAISAGLINRAKVIVMDEVHEAGIDTSLARAIVHKRLQNGDGLKVLEMSATMDATRQAGYWGDVSESVIHKTHGQAFARDERYIKPKSFRPEEQTRELAQVTVDLMEKDGRKGTAIIRSGVAEVNEAANAIRNQLKQKNITNVEVETIYGEMDSKDRKKATRAPQPGNRKILVGTNVIESGINLPWLDSLISDGQTKVPYYRESGAEALVLDDLPQWRLTQQKGRVGRMPNRETPDIFVLFSEKNIDERIERTIPEIERAPLEAVVIHCASLGLNPLELKFDSNVDSKKLQHAKERLQRLGLIDSEWHLTKAGKYTSKLPIGPEAGAMLWEAKEKGILEDAIELAAIIEVGGIRKDFRSGHGLDTTSDVIDSLKAFRAFDAQNRSQSAGGKDSLLEKLNVSFKRFYEAKELIRELRGRHSRQELQSSKDASDKDLQEIILAGNIDRLFESKGSYRPLIGYDGSSYNLERASAVLEDARFITGELREIRPKKGSPFTLVQNATAIPEELLLEFAAKRPGAFSDLTIHQGYDGKDRFSVKYFGNASLEFRIPETLSPAMRKLIEPQYSKSKLRQNAKSLAQHFGISDETTAIENAESFQDVVDKLLNHPAWETGLPAYISTESEAKAGTVRLGSIQIGEGSGKQALHLDVAEGSLSAEQAMQLVKKYPEFLQIEKSNVGDDIAHALELNGNQIIIHTADEDAWKNDEGKLLSETIKPALKSGVDIVVSPALVIDMENIVSKYFPYGLHEEYDAYSHQDIAEVTTALEHYKEKIRAIAIQELSQVELTPGDYDIGKKWLIPIAQKEALAEAQKPLEALTLELEQRTSERQDAVEQVKAAIKQDTAIAVSVGNNTNYVYSEYQLATGESFMPMLDALLTVKEIAASKTPDDTTIDVKKVAFHPNGETKITLAFDMPEEKFYEIASGLADHIKEAAANQGLTIEASPSYYDREIIFTAHVPVVSEGKQVSAADRVAAIEVRIEAHIEASQKTIELKEAKALEAKAEATRKAEEEARKVKELQEKEAREISHAEKTQAKLIEDLRMIADAGKGLPRDMKNYRPHLRTRNYDSLVSVLYQLQSNGVSNKTTAQLLDDVVTDRKAIHESGSVAETMQKLGQGGSGLFAGARVMVAKGSSSKPKPPKANAAPHSKSYVAASETEKPTGRGNEEVEDHSAALAALQEKFGRR